ncbi:MAG: lipase family protein, partial [Acidimicrobiales bacterium]
VEKDWRGTAMVRRAGRRGEQGDGLATRLLRAPVHRARSGDRSGAGRARRSVRRAAASVTMALALALALVAALLATSAATVGAATVGTPSASPQPPTQDPFYVWSGSLSTVPPGTVLRSRAVSVPYLSSVPVTATQLLYRTTNELGQPAVTVTTVLQPVGASPTKLVSWQMFYDALGAQCDPSYEMQGGGGIGGAQEEEQLMTPYLDAGDTVTVPDYEGENLAWLAGQQSGYQTLDGIRATEQWLHMAPATTPVALIGYSGGSVATQWAAEMAPAYAPELHIVGSAAGGVPVDPAHNLTYLEGGNDPSSSSWDGVIPAVLVGTAERGFGVDLTPYLSAYGQEVANQVSDECINSFAGDYPGLTMAQLLKPQYQDFLSVPIFASVVNELTMGTDGTPTSPMFLAVGNADGTGDGVMVAGDVEALAHLYCERGVPVQFDEYNGLSHVLAAVPFEATALSLITAWLAGAPTPDNCTTIGTGASGGGDRPARVTGRGRLLRYGNVGGAGGDNQCRRRCRHRDRRRRRRLHRGHVPDGRRPRAGRSRRLDRAVLRRAHCRREHLLVVDRGRLLRRYRHVPRLVEPRRRQRDGRVATGEHRRRRRRSMHRRHSDQRIEPLPLAAGRDRLRGGGRRTTRAAATTITRAVATTIGAPVAMDPSRRSPRTPAGAMIVAMHPTPSPPVHRGAPGARPS